jgi:hypothetical protein
MMPAALEALMSGAVVPLNLGSTEDCDDVSAATWGCDPPMHTLYERFWSEIDFRAI